MTNPQAISHGIDPSTIAVLAERVDRMLKDHGEIKGMILAQNHAISQFAVIQKDILILDNKSDRMFKALDAATSVLGEHGKKLHSHSLIWKVATVVVLSCLGVVGWGYSQVQRSIELANSNERRILMLEFQTQGPSKAVQDQLLKAPEAKK